MNFENEIWKPIEDCQDYQISNMGRVKNIKTNKMLNLCTFQTPVCYNL
jgi:hypothetical protein